MRLIQLPDITLVLSGYLCNSCSACFTSCNHGAISYAEIMGKYLFSGIDQNNRGIGKYLSMGIFRQATYMILLMMWFAGFNESERKLIKSYIPFQTKRD